jgi:hypothetical protein
MAKDIGMWTERLFIEKERKSDLNEQLKKVNEEIRKLEMTILDEMQKQGLYKAGGKGGSVYIARQIVPKVVNWDQLYKYIQEHEYFHMLERRVSRKAFQEQYEDGQQVPGCEPVVFDELRTRRN